jgi:hypothetical protein
MKCSFLILEKFVKIGILCKLFRQRFVLFDDGELFGERWSHCEVRVQIGAYLSSDDVFYLGTQGQLHLCLLGVVYLNWLVIIGNGGELRSFTF